MALFRLERCLLDNVWSTTSIVGPQDASNMDEFDKLALAAAREVMRNEDDTSQNDQLRNAASMVLNMAFEKGWLSHAGDENTPAQ